MSWDGQIDPNAEEFQNEGGTGEKTRWCGEGRKVLAAIGYERWESGKGNPMLSVRFVCLDDLQGDASEVGAHVWRNFALTQAAVQFFARFARAINFLSPFNVFKDEDVQAILAKGAVIGKVETETYTRNDGKEGEKSEVKFFDRYEGNWEPGWDEITTAAEEVWDKYLDWREKNPRGQKRQDRRGGSSGGSSGGGSQTHLPSQDEDIPF